MSRISYLNGQFLPHENCLIHIEDRGFQFADGIYEVTLCVNNKLIDGDLHIARLLRNLSEMKIEHNFSAEELKKIQLELFARNKMTSGSCYLQITRGATNRVPYLPKNLAPTISATVSPRKMMSPEEFENGFTFMTHEDIRWQRCDIKSISLFAASFLNQKAKNSGFDDAILVRDGVVTEGSFSNIFIVDKNETIITKAPGNHILQGITRNRLIKIAQEKGFRVEERDFSIDEMLDASEVFLTSSVLLLRPASKINGQEISGGKNRKITTILYRAYEEFINN